MEIQEKSETSFLGRGGRYIRTAAFLIAAMFVMTAGKSEALAASDGINYNVCGIVNRPLSVDPTGRTEGFSAVLYDNSNGLPTSEANAIAETEEGFIWIGSYAGLIRYDGNTFERMDSTGGITSIKCLYVDSKNRLWIGTNDNGVAMMENGEFRIWNKMDGLVSAHTRAITEDLNGTIYIGTNSGITMIDPEFNLITLDDPEIAEADMRNLRVADDGTVYGTTDNGELMVIRDGKLVNHIAREETPLEGVGVILPDPGNPGIIYAESAESDLYYVDMHDGFKILKKIDINPLRYLLSMEYIDGKIWICAGNGIGVLDRENFRLMDNLPMNNNVGHVMTDYLGNLWFTSTRQGVMKVVPNQFSDLFVRYGIEATVVNATSLCQGKLFVATDAGLIVLDEKGVVSKLPLTKAVTASGVDLETEDLLEFLTDCRIRSVIRDSKDRLWISTWRANGLLCYDRGELTAFTMDDGMLSNNIRAVSERKDGSIIVAVTGGVNVIADERIVAAYGKEDGFVNTETLTVAEGENGDIIVGSNGGGIYIVNNSGVRAINVEDGLPSDIVMRVRKDLKRDLYWLVTSSAIAYMTPDYQVTTVKKFPYPNNFDLYQNSMDDLWVLSSNGIYVVPTEEMIANGEISPVFYNMASGLPCIATANSYSELTSGGDLYIAGSTGVGKVNIEQPFEDVSELKAVVPYMEADGQEIYPDISGTMTIPSSTHKLTVLGFVYNYSLSDPLVTYQLEGFDRHSTTVNRSEMLPVDYTNLRGGTYHFVMQIRDSLGRGSKVVSVKIVKEKAFYEQTWFYFVVALMAIGILVIGVRDYIRRRMQKLERQRQEAREQFEQTAEALASAIDAKDKYTNGHSRRVAEYSVKIAKAAGKAEEECEKIYFAALLHDVGKIGVPMEILTKNARLTDSEFEQIKEHPVAGGEILSKIKNSPWLSIGARYHHERINGTGYPERLKGDDIPEIARIIAVADAYDAMTSNRSYRKAIPQHIVREELVKGIGTQFDPEFAKIMIHLIDLDTEYLMQESISGASVTATTSLRCDELYHGCTNGIGITRRMAHISLCSQPDDGVPEEQSLPVLIVFDALDGNVHPGEENNRNILYYEYAQIRLDGQVSEKGARKIEVRDSELETDIEPGGISFPERGQRYRVEAVRNRDHVLVRVANDKRVFEVILALPDTSRYAYISISGAHCEVHNIMIGTDEEDTDPQAIPRIAKELSFIENCPVGDMPNVQIDGPQLSYTEGMPVKDRMTITFHAMSLPTARLVWHCPYISLFTSMNGQPYGLNFSEYLTLRLDGEAWSFDDNIENEVQVERLDSFEGWDVWKEKSKQGFDCTVELEREADKITMRTENMGIAIRCVSTFRDTSHGIFVALTGDQCALTDIHVKSDM